MKESVGGRGVKESGEEREWKVEEPRRGKEKGREGRKWKDGQPEKDRIEEKEEEENGGLEER